MLSSIIVRSSKILSICLFLYACENEPTEPILFDNYDPSKATLLYESFVMNIDEAPVHFIDTWNKSVIQQTGIKSITLYTKGGKNPEDTLEKKIFRFSEDAKTMNYADYRYDETPNNWSKGTIKTSNSQGSIEFDNYYGIKRKTKTKIIETKEAILFLRTKSNNSFDSTWVVGSLEQPKKIISKIGKSLYSVELFMPSGSSNSQIENAFKSLGYSDQALLLAEKTVVFVEKGKPVNAFSLNETYSQVAQIRSWTYNKEQQLTLYEEQMGNTVTKSISFTYRKDQLPATMTIDRKLYFYSYE